MPGLERFCSDIGVKRFGFKPGSSPGLKRYWLRWVSLPLCLIAVGLGVLVPLLKIVEDLGTAG